MSKAIPQRIYELLLDSKLFAAFSQEAAEIRGEEGGSFTMFGGRTVGPNVELVPNQRIGPSLASHLLGSGSVFDREV